MNRSLGSAWRVSLAFYLLLHAQIGLGQDQSTAPNAKQKTWQTECAPIPETWKKNAENIRFEHCLRFFRFHRLAEERGIASPHMEELILTKEDLPILEYDIPAIRISWESSTFFDFDEHCARADANPIVALVADAISRDIADVHLYLVGHTDAVGSASYNQALSLRRATHVAELLASKGVAKRQMTYTGMGSRQPVASNMTEVGRSLNRRVEFMVSAFSDVNVALVQKREVNALWLAASDVALKSPPEREKSVEVFKLGEKQPYKIFELPPPTSVTIKTVSSD